MTLFVFLVTLGYLMGSICSAVIVCRLFGLPDPREEGSKNPGATNVLRIAGKEYAILVMVADLLKGTIPVLIAKSFNAEPVTIGFTALAAVIGHMYPIFFGFKGGKGVATAIGALLGFHFIIGVMVSATWLLVANFGHYSSLASIISISLAPFYNLLLIGRLDTFPPLFIIAILVLFKHKNNITRLIDGEEPKIKLKHHKDHNIIEEIIEPQSRVIVEKENVKKAADIPLLQKEIPAKSTKANIKVKKTTKTEEPIKKPKTTKATKTKTDKASDAEKTIKKPTKKTTPTKTKTKTKTEKPKADKAKKS